MNCAIQIKSTNPRRTCLTCTPGGGSLCAPLTEQDVATIQSYKSTILTVEPGEYLYRENDAPGALFGIVEGWAMLYATMPDGARQILDFTLPGEFVSFQPITGVDVPHAARALTVVTACVFLQADFERLLREHPRLATAMIWLSARCEARAFDHLSNVSRRPARARLLHLVLELYYRRMMRLPDRPGDSFALPLTQQHIADALGLTPEHINRTIRELREDGLLELRNGSATLLDPAACIAEGGLDAGAFLPTALSQRGTVGRKAG